MKKNGLLLLSFMTVPFLANCANKQPIEQYCVTFESNGGSHINAQIVNKGDVINNPGLPSKDGYSFKGWYLTNPDPVPQEEAFNFSNPITQDTILYAYWTDNTLYYDFEFNGQHCSILNDSNYTKPHNKEGSSFQFIVVPENGYLLPSEIAIKRGKKSTTYKDGVITVNRIDSNVLIEAVAQPKKLDKHYITFNGMNCEAKNEEMLESESDFQIEGYDGDKITLIVSPNNGYILDGTIDFSVAGKKEEETIYTYTKDVDSDNYLLSFTLAGETLISIDAALINVKTSFNFDGNYCTAQSEGIAPSHILQVEGYVGNEITLIISPESSYKLDGTISFSVNGQEVLGAYSYTKDADSDNYLLSFTLAGETIIKIEALKNKCLISFSSINCKVLRRDIEGQSPSSCAQFEVDVGKNIEFLVSPDYGYYLANSTVPYVVVDGEARNKPYFVFRYEDYSTSPNWILSFVVEKDTFFSARSYRNTDPITTTITFDASEGTFAGGVKTYTINAYQDDKIVPYIRSIPQPTYYDDKPFAYYTYKDGSSVEYKDLIEKDNIELVAHYFKGDVTLPMSVIPDSISWQMIKNISATNVNLYKIFTLNSTRIVQLKHQQDDIYQTVRIIDFFKDRDKWGTPIGITFEFTNLICDENGHSLATYWNDVNDYDNCAVDYRDSSIREALNGDEDSNINWFQYFGENEDAIGSGKNRKFSEKFANKSVLSMLPDALSSVLTVVANKSVSVYNDSAWKEVKIYDKLFLLSPSEGCIEISGEAPYETYYSYVNKKRYDKYHINDNDTRISALSGNDLDGNLLDNDKSSYAGYGYVDTTPSPSRVAGAYWFRSPITTETDVKNKAYYYDYGGYKKGVTCSMALGVVPLFCL